jgi:hypothetical protein
MRPIVRSCWSERGIAEKQRCVSEVVHVLRKDKVRTGGLQVGKGVYD